MGSPRGCRWRRSARRAGNDARRGGDGVVYRDGVRRPVDRGGGTVRTARRAGRGRGARGGKVSEGIRDKYLRVVREATGPRGDSRAHLLVGSDDVDVEPAGPVERLDDLRESGGGDAVVVDHENVRAPRRARVVNGRVVHHLSFACVYSPEPRASGASPEKRPRSSASSSALARYPARSSRPRVRALVGALARASVPSAASRVCVSE